uniref:Peptidase S1 domain-containing protein n=1 Tax=Strongyloides venezuelensis TaxID=75913 RepID=A0A0K0FGY1_STRVS
MLSSIFSGISSLFRRTKRVEELGNEITRDDSTIVSETEENESSFVNQRKRKYDFTNDKKLECSDIRKNIKSMLNCTSIGSKKKENYEHLKNVSFFKEIQCNSHANESKKLKFSKKKETYLRAYTDDYFVSADRKIIDAFEKHKYDYIVSACFHTFKSKSNIGASYTIIGKDFVFTSSCRLRKNTTDNFIIAKKYKYDYIVSACIHTFGSKSNIGASYTIIGKDFVFTSSCRLRKNTTDNFIIAKILHDGIVEACEKFPHAKQLVFGDNPVY